MSETPRPVRAWAEYDEIALFWHDDDAQTWLTPKGGEWYPRRFDDVPWIVSTMEQLQLVKYGPGPLRSIRILLSTGHEVEVRPSRGDEDDWSWRLTRGGNYCTSGLFDRTTGSDADAISRALAEAVAWIEQQGVTA